MQVSRQASGRRTILLSARQNTMLMVIRLLTQPSLKSYGNGQVVHEDVEVVGVTRGAMLEEEAATGPLMLQGDHGPVAFRNVVLKPI